MPGCSACGGGNSSNQNYSMKGNIVKRAPVKRGHIKITNYQQYRQYRQYMAQLQQSRRAYGLKF